MKNPAPSSPRRSRFTKAIAGIALAAALAGGASIASDQAVAAEDTTESTYMLQNMRGWGVSWR